MTTSPYRVGQSLYRAVCVPHMVALDTLNPRPEIGPVEDPRIVYERYVVTKVTPKGAWVTRFGPERWVSATGKWCSPTKAMAKDRLRARTVAYLRHAHRRLKDAEARAEVLGLPVERLRLLGGE